MLDPRRFISLIFPVNYVTKNTADNDLERTRYSGWVTTLFYHVIQGVEIKILQQRMFLGAYYSLYPILSMYSDHDASLTGGDLK